MNSAIQYLINSSGSKTSVVLPLNRWEELNDKYQKLLTKLQILTGIKEGICEVQEARRKGKKLQTLADFLNECRD